MEEPRPLRSLKAAESFKLSVLSYGLVQVANLLHGFMVPAFKGPSPFGPLLKWMTVGFILLFLFSLVNVLHQVHWDLWRLHDDYPIKPDDAIINLLIPGLNLIFWWRMWKTAADHLPPARDRRLPSIPQALPWSYVFLLLTAVASPSRGTTSIGMKLSGFAIDMGLLLSCFVLVYSLMQGVTEQARSSGKIRVDAT